MGRARASHGLHHIPARSSYELGLDARPDRVKVSLLPSSLVQGYAQAVMLLVMIMLRIMMVTETVAVTVMVIVVLVELMMIMFL